MTIQQELVGLTSADGFIQPRLVVEWAREHPGSELHQHIEWDDAKAADAHRLHQVRQLIRIHVLTDDRERSTISLYQDRKPEGGYRHVENVLRNSELREMAVGQALHELRRWQEKYKYLKELADLFAAIDENRPPPPDSRRRPRRENQPSAEMHV